MSRLLSRIMLAMFMFPLAGIVYVASILLFERWLGRWLMASYPRSQAQMFAFSSAVVWIFLAGYWLLLWFRSVRWSLPRRMATMIAVGVAALAGVGIAVALNEVADGVGSFLGSVSAPMLWLVATVFIWRETEAERAERLKGSGAQALACPVCGYNLTGLSEARCPECGARFTLSDLLAGQRSRESTEIER